MFLIFLIGSFIDIRLSFNPERRKAVFPFDFRTFVNLHKCEGSREGLQYRERQKNYPINMNMKKYIIPQAELTTISAERSFLGGASEIPMGGETGHFDTRAQCNWDDEWNTYAATSHTYTSIPAETSLSGDVPYSAYAVNATYLPLLGLCRALLRNIAYG